MIRTAVVGVGEVAEWHRRGLANAPGTSLVGIADRDTELLEHRSVAWGVPGYETFEALLADIEVDWVHVCTPLQTHYDLAMTAVETGVAVLVEKPFVETRAEYESLTDAAEEADVRVSVVHNQAYYAPFRRAVRRMAAGEFGRLRGVSVRWAEDLDPGDPDRGEWVLEIPGGEFGEGIAHPIYMGLRAAGYPADENAVSTHRINAVGDDRFDYDGIMVGYTTADGVACSIQHHSSVPDRRRIDFAAEDAHVTVDIATQSVRVERHNYGPNTPFEYPMLRAAAGELRGAARTAVRAIGESVRSTLDPSYTPHDTHTPVIRREAAALRGRGDGATPRAELDWTNYVFTELNGR